MKKQSVKALLMAGIIAFSTNVFADPITTPSEEKKIELGNDTDKSGSTTFDATNSVTIKNDFECKKGATLEIK